MNRINELTDSVPSAPEFEIDWERIKNTVMKPYFTAMKAALQSPIHHAEGDVWTHTKMVCESLVKDPAFVDFSPRDRQELFLAALFHDVGKIRTTRVENGEITSPRHAAVGSGMVRALFYRDYGIGGTEQLQNFRETVCFLIRYHMIVPYIPESDEPERKLIRTAANSELAPDFSLAKLFTLSKADAEGKIASDGRKSTESAILAFEAANDAGCLCSPVGFTSPFTEFAYLYGRNVTPETDLYNDTVCSVIIMCGLPGVGKDTYIKKYYPEYRVISLDEIRKELKVSPTDDQSEVIKTAKARAKQLLRQKQSFVWNATSFTADMRAGLFFLFNSYHAYVKIVYLETDYETNLKRNKNRKDPVPEYVMDKMISKLIPPERYEAHEVIWKCV